ncbi:4Fe-4S dicluster domain-containing protein [Micromonospora sp. WMMD712]|uniref:4Fe-4S binding protein n=1 Tax=Micromonospora TaxID=1873 RepID=UPI002499B41F|nr:4Fe-4S dicluster domain-containing protein [Micromonospora sp. WMMD712]WFE61424.1 4Fe-4S binding protein [Micromonospora sp. WMMD712]
MPAPAAAPPARAPVTIVGCQGCGACLLTCPTHAIRPTPGGLLVRAQACTGCLECLEICPVDAIRVTGTDPCGGTR